MATLCVNLVNFGPVIPDLNIGLRKVSPTVVYFFKINLSDKLSQDPSDRFSLTFHSMYGGIRS